MSKVERAIRYATHAHEGQVRKHSGLPYVVHPVEVMKTLSNWGVTDETILTAAVLHDVIEDTGVTKEQIAYEFGLNVAVMVMECTRPKEQADKKGKLDFLKSFSEKSEGSVLIKLADRFCNVEDYLKSYKTNYAYWYAYQAYPLLNEYEKRKLWTIYPKSVNNVSENLWISAVLGLGAIAKTDVHDSIGVLKEFTDKYDYDFLI